MYDVIYIDDAGSEIAVAQHLADKQDACERARVAAAERGAGRMMLAGSTKIPNTVCVVHTDDLAA